MLADEIQRRCFDWLDQPVAARPRRRGLAAVSQVLERAAFVGLDEIEAGYARMMADQGRPLA